MRKTAKQFIMTTGTAVLFGALAFNAAKAADAPAAAPTPLELGKAVAEDRVKGNCFACHDYAGAVLPGNVGPKLINMKARYPDKDKLRAQIWDATKANPNTIMPPFGRHRMLTEKEIDAVVEWVYSL